MMKSMACIFISLFMFGCITKDDENNKIDLNGTFTEEDPGSEYLSQHIFSNGNEYKRIEFDLEEGCIVWETAGEFEIKDWGSYPYKSLAPDSLNSMNMAYISITNTKGRERENLDCSESFGSWSDEAAWAIPVRNLTSYSFEIFINNEDIGSPSRWEKFLKN